MTEESWELIDSGVCSAKENMDRDAELLASLKTHPRHILRFYEWKSPSLTYGHFVNPEDLLHLTEAEQLGVDIARRPTGGGVISHFTDFTFSILVPKDSLFYTSDTLKNYCFINRRIVKALQSVSEETLELLETSEEGGDSLDRFCMAKPTVLDVMCGSSKVSGGAQRRTRYGFLHQGTISLTPPNWDWLFRMIKSKEVVDQMQLRSHYLPNTERDQLKQAIIQCFPSHARPPQEKAFVPIHYEAS